MKLSNLDLADILFLWHLVPETSLVFRFTLKKYFNFSITHLYHHHTRQIASEGYPLGSGPPGIIKSNTKEHHNTEPTNNSLKFLLYNQSS